MLMIALVIALSSEFIANISFGNSTLTIVVAIPLFICSLFVLVLVARYLLRLYRGHTAGVPAAPLQLRQLLFFFLVVTLASVPQTLLAIAIIRSTLNTWLGIDVEQTLRRGQNITLYYYDRQVRSVAALGSSPLFDELLQNAEEDPIALWGSVQRTFPIVDSLQIFGPNTEEHFFAGVETARLSISQALELRSGFPLRDSTPRADFLRYIRTYSSVDGDLRIIISSALPSEFGVSASRLTDAIGIFGQLSRSRSRYLLTIALLYAIFALPLFLMAIVASILISNELARPVLNLEQATQRVAAGDYGYRILTRSNQGLGHLVGLFNRMVQELERSRRRLLQTDKVMAWREIAQHLAHEIKNPLTPIRLSVDRALRKYRAGSDDFGPTFEASSQTILREVDALTRLLNEFRDFSRPPAIKPHPVELRDIVCAAAESCTYSDIEFDYRHVDPDCRAIADPDQLRRVFANLFHNAIEAIEGPGTIVIHADHIQRGHGNYLRIQVRDNGSGIDSRLYSQVFNPYFTTKSKGTGLGLSVVERIVTDHEGRIWFESVAGQGTTFFIDLPEEH